MKKALIFLRSFLAAGVLLGSMVFAKEPVGEKGKNDDRSLAKTAAYQPDRYQILNINNLWTWHRNDGQANHSPTGDNGLFFPRGTKWVIYQDGMVFGSRAYVDAAKTIPAPFSQKIRVGGTTYATGQRAGWVDGFGAAAVPHDPGDLKARIYRIRRDWKEMSNDELRRDAAESNEIAVTAVTQAQVQQISDRYAKDWNEWPVDIGAPFIDRNKNGTYEPPPAGFPVADLIAKGYDEPGVAGADLNSPADQVLWCVFNDLNRSTSTGRFGSEPTGLEIQMTMWAYKRSDALGNMYFRKWRFINKGGVDIDANSTKGSLYLDSMYVCQWSDPDLGDAGDDLAGCDIDLSMGFIYNGNPVDSEYRKVSLPPPASGYDFLQGPIIPSPGDRAVFDLKYRNGFKNLGMAGFSYFSAGSAYTDPTGGYATNTIRWDKMLRGYAPLSGADVRYAHPTGVEAGPFPLSGDPVAKTGHIDGQGQPWSFVPGDRRILVITGPFNMAPADTQEVVVANVAGIGADRLSSVAVLKFNDRFAQNTYDALFQVPKAPAGPDVKVTLLDGHVVMEWGSNLARVNETEGIVNEPGSYAFEGYNIYQLPTANSSLADGRRIATYDLETDPAVILDTQADPASGQVLQVPIHFGSNSGITRYFKFDRDYIRDINKLNNGEEYYVAVTSYSTSKVDGYIPAALESPAQILTVVPQSRRLGQTVPSKFGETVAVSHAAGIADATLSVAVVDPAKVTGNNYEFRIVANDSISIDADLDPANGDETKVANHKWTIVNTATSKTLFGPSSDFNINSANPIVEGLQVGFFGAPYWVAGTEVAYQAYAKSGQDINTITIVTASNWTGVNAGLSFFGGGLDVGANFFGSALLPFQVTKTVEVRFNSAEGQNAYNFVRAASSGGAPYTGFFPQPFKVFDVTNPASPRQIDFAIMEQNASTFQNNIWGPGAASGDREYFFFIDENYTATAKAEYTGSTLSFTGTKPVLYAGWYILKDATKPAYQDGDVWRIKATNVLTTGDRWTFNTATLKTTQSTDQAKQELARVGVFPNPYFALNPQETNKLSRFVTFNNLPEQATIRIFNLAGQLVRTINHNGGAFKQWNLLNNSNFPVASGMYIAHVEMPGLGERVLKLAVVQEKEVLDTF